MFIFCHYLSFFFLRWGVSFIEFYHYFENDIQRKVNSSFKQWSLEAGVSAGLCFAHPLSLSWDLDSSRQWHPTPVLWPGKSHGWRSLVGCSPWGRKESDTTERLHFHFSLSCIGEANGDPLQCSCLENPRDGGACDSMESHRVRHN